MTARAQSLLAEATARLQAAGVPDAARDARRLLAHALGVAQGRLTLVLGDPVTADGAARFDALVARRSAREPVSHLTGTRTFWGRDFIVTPDVLDPRPETETLVAAALQAPFARVLDLGTGSGCILLTLLAERPVARGAGCDLSEAALAVAARNREALGLGDRATLRAGDWFAALEAGTARFDLIVSNPPYIAASEMPALAPETRDHEPRGALTDEGDGLAAYRTIAAGAGAWLVPGGRLMVEIGPTQAGAVAALFGGAGLADVAVLPDMDGRDRVVVATAPR
ncbi:peptide chain release factor N(5)-glutamine methyltransferase [Citreimonas salinaria]|uniref:Release factor glutamine methyltransferase n=1 Tax=Citreimonas salinaria TaxID=321339 RepID=A0A1H3H0U2_9RHOB|nr:peptide chain release factor N(5)-glutamine methyltransferase [Citreimonas salinaria]SDY08950.1 [protein release factor]-glutamine N5-methyltransferase [Citreimonas salinaria]